MDQGEAEFANNAASTVDEDDDDNAAVVVFDASGNAIESDTPVVLTPVQDDNYGEDAIPAPIAEPGLEGEPVVQEFTEDGLAVAMAVDTAAEDEFIYSAIEYDPDSKPPLHKNRRFRVYTCIALIIVVSVISLVVVYITKSAKGDEITNDTVLWGGAPTVSPTVAPTTNRMASGIDKQIEAGVLQRDITFKNISKSDPRYLALDWILHYDELQLESDDKNLYQRYILALLAFTLDSLAWFACGEHRTFGNVTEKYKNDGCEVTNQATGQMEEHKVWLSSTEECEWYGVICSSDEVVRGVELSKYLVIFGGGGRSGECVVHFVFIPNHTFHPPFLIIPPHKQLEMISSVKSHPKFPNSVSSNTSPLTVIVSTARSPPSLAKCPTYYPSSYTVMDYRENYPPKCTMLVRSNCSMLRCNISMRISLKCPTGRS